MNASVILTDPQGNETRVDMTPEPARARPVGGVGASRLRGPVDVPRGGVGANSWGTWHHNAEAKLPAGVDIELVCLEGKDPLERTAAVAEAAGDPIEASILRAHVHAAHSAAPRQGPARRHQRRRARCRHADVRPAGDGLPHGRLPFVDRQRALFASWYEFFPLRGRHLRRRDGHLDLGHLRHLPQAPREEIAAMGFDVVYFPPIHPIGSAFKKGKNNSSPPPRRIRAPWRSAPGRRPRRHPPRPGRLGELRLAGRQGDRTSRIEIALDFALQASPDHPWVIEHPEWFTTRLDGTIAYAENPPKKYQDIYPINFDNDPGRASTTRCCAS